MIRLGKQLGKGGLGVVITMLIVVLLIYLLIKFFPSTHKSYTFKQAMRNEAQLARSTPGYDQQLRVRLIKKAGDLSLPITPDCLKIEIAHGYATITATYDVEIKTFFHTFHRHFEQKVENPIFR
jgi:hypothetical protein